MSDYKNKMEEKRKIPYTIYAENTPNPLSMKFVANKMLNNSDPIEFLSTDSAVESPIAQRLFQMPFVKSVFIAGNYVTVNKTDAVEWHEVVMELRMMITEFLNDGNVALIQNESGNGTISSDKAEDLEPQKELSEMDLKISEILDEYVRPAVEQDGGAINFHSFEKGVVTVNLKGACSGCPSASLTLKSGIETILKRLVPEVNEVVAIEL